MTWSIPYNRIAIPARLADILSALHRAQCHGAALESALAAALRHRFGRASVVFYASARYALTAYLRTLPPNSGDVLIPAFGCTILIDSVRAAGLRPVLIDIELERYGLDPKALQRRAAGAAAVVAVHEFGIPFDGSIPPLVRGHGVPLVEDIAVGFGATRGNGRVVGLDGDVVLLSGGLGKPFSAARFGALVGGADLLRPRGPQVQKLGLSSALSTLAGRVLGHGSVFAAFWRLLELEAGREERLMAAALTESPSRFDIALLLQLLERYDTHIANRRRTADAVMAVFADFGWRPPFFGADRPVFGRLPFLLPPGIARERAITEFRQEGIDLSIPGRRSLIDRVPGTISADLPNTVLAQEYCLVLTLRPDLTNPQDIASRARAALSRIGVGPVQ